MMRVAFDCGALKGEQRTWWDAWQKRAEDATNEIIDAWEDWKEKYDKDPAGAGKFDPPWKSKIWGDLKAWLLENVFYWKCAYCETKIIRHFNDAEHHRPKGKVTYAGETHQELAHAVDERGNRIPHPGYFWLAYNWKNLLPSCEMCNAGSGKQTQFPTKDNASFVLTPKVSDSDRGKLAGKLNASKKWQNVVYLDVEDLNVRESPSLLHPYFDNPDDHLHFDAKGIEVAVGGSFKGKASIEVFQLSDKNLRAQRQKTQDCALNEFLAACMNGDGTPDERIQIAEKRLLKYDRGEEAYSAAARHYVADVRRKLGK